MHVFHPPQMTNGVPPENYFVVADSANSPIAEGFLIPTYHPYLFPERPVNMFLSVHSKGPGRDMLLGALLARAYQLHTQMPQWKARIFAQVGAQDTDMLSFYTDGGFQVDDSVDVVQLYPPNVKPNAPMGYDMRFVPLQTPQEQQAFLYRLNTNRLDVLSLPLLQRYMSMSHFVALYISRGQELVGEVVLAGESGAAKLVGLYVIPNYRRLGLGKALVSAGMKYLADQGVTLFEGNVTRRNMAQCKMARSCNATFIRNACFFPGVNYD